MWLERYDFVKDPVKLQYEFVSEGPKGKIRKIVEFFDDYPHIYNLAFGDSDFTGEYIHDTIVTNNSDRDKVLATVAGIIVDFVKKHPGAIVLAKGSTESRNRLYQIGIARYWDEITHQFEISGLTKKGWEPFKKNKNYEGFLLKLK